MKIKTSIYLVRHGETEWNRELRIQGHSDIPLNHQGREQARALQSRLCSLRPHFVYSSDLSRCTETACLALPLRETPEPDPGSHFSAKPESAAIHSPNIAATHSPNDVVNHRPDTKQLAPGADLYEGLPCENLSRKGLPWTTSTALRERCFGEWEGLCREEIQAKYPGLYEQWTARKPGFCAPGAETNSQVRKRVSALLEQTVGAHPDGCLFLFTHGGTILSAISYVLDAPVDNRLPIRLANGSISCIEWINGRWVVSFLNDTCHLQAKAKTR